MSRFFNFLELRVAKLNALLVSLLMLVLAGVARAAEIPDAPIPEPNYLGIVVFLGLFFGLGIWFMWKVMRNKGDDKK
jgi:hypothetical protein